MGRSTPPDSTGASWSLASGRPGALLAAANCRSWISSTGDTVSFWGVDVLGNGETAAKAKDFMQKAGYALPLAFGNEKSSVDLGGDGLPFLIIMDKFGRVRLVHNGYDRSEPLQSELSKVIEALLNEG